MKTNVRETIDNVIRLVNKKYNIDMITDKSEIGVYARIYLAKKLYLINMTNKYIAAIFNIGTRNVSNMINLKGYDREKYIQYKDKFKKLETKDKERLFSYIPIFTEEYNEEFFIEKDNAIKQLIKSFRYTFEKNDTRIMTTDKPITVSFNKIHKLKIILSMEYNGKLYIKEYYYSKLNDY